MYFHCRLTVDICSVVGGRGGGGWTDRHEGGNSGLDYAHVFTQCAQSGINPKNF